MFFCSLLLTNTVKVFGDIDPSIIFHPPMSKHVAQKNRYGVTLFWRITRRRDWWSCWRQTRDCVEGYVPVPSSCTKTSFHRGKGVSTRPDNITLLLCASTKGIWCFGRQPSSQGKTPHRGSNCNFSCRPSIGILLCHHHHHSWLNICR
jgi:hypothetical protein